MDADRTKSPKVLAIAFYFPPDAGSGSLRNLKILKYLPEHGYDLCVLTRTASEAEMLGSAELSKQIPNESLILRATFFDSHQVLGRLKSLLTGNRSRGETASSGTQAISSADEECKKSWFGKLKDAVTRLISIPDRYVSWLPFAFLRGFFHSFFRRPQVIYAVGKPWTGLFIGFALKIVLFRPLVIDFMDPWNGVTTWRRAPTRIDRWLEKFICNRADFIIANTAPARRDFIERVGVPEDRVGVITCGYDHIDFPEERPQLSTLKRSSRPFTITHTGTFYSKRRPGPFLAAVKKLLESQRIDSSDIRIQLIGKMYIEDELSLSMLSDPILEPILHREDWVPHEEVIEKLFDSDLLLLVQPDLKLQIPAKLYEYVASHQPILALANEEGAVAELLLEENWGKVVDSENIDAIAATLEGMYASLRNQSSNQLKAQNVENYSTRNLARKLTDIFDSVTRERHVK